MSWYPSIEIILGLSAEYPTHHFSFFRNMCTEDLRIENNNVGEGGVSVSPNTSYPTNVNTISN